MVKSSVSRVYRQNWNSVNEETNKLHLKKNGMPPLR